MPFVHLYANLSAINLCGAADELSAARTRITTLAEELQKAFCERRAAIRAELIAESRVGRNFCKLDLRARVRSGYFYIEWSTLQRVKSGANGTRLLRGHVEKPRNQGYDDRVLCRKVPEPYHVLIREAEACANKLRTAHARLRSLEKILDSLSADGVGRISRATPGCTVSSEKVESPEAPWMDW